MLELFKHVNLFLHSIRLCKLELHVLLFEDIDVFIELRDLDILLVLLNGELLSLFLALDPLLRQLRFKVTNHLLLIGLSILSELVDEITHAFDLTLSVVEELFIL